MKESELLAHAEAAVARLRDEVRTAGFKLDIRKVRLREAQGAVEDAQVEYNDLVSRVAACESVIARIGKKCGNEVNPRRS